LLGLGWLFAWLLALIGLYKYGLCGLHVLRQKLAGKRSAEQKT
jgi:hypothetical protein